MKLAYKNGVTSVVLRVKIMDSTSTTGGAKTGLTNASAGLIISTIADNEATATAYTAAGSTIDSITTLGTFAAPTAGHCRFKEVDATNHPGVYEIQIADARWAVSGARSVIITVSGATGAAQVDAEVQLTTVDVNDVNGGLQGLKGTTNPTAGALPTIGTGTGQINPSGGKVPATMGSGDYTGNTPQTGDSFARIGATGSGLTSLAPASTALSNATWTNARAGYLDNLNVGGAVASHADIVAINQSASKHVLLVTVSQFEPGETYTVEGRTFAAADGSAVNADTTPTLTATGQVSGNLNANLSAATNPATGVYRWTYTPGASPTLEQIRFDISATINSSTFTLSTYSQTVDEATAVFTATDQSHLTSIFNKLPTNNIADETLVINATNAILTAVGTPQQSGSAVTLPAIPTGWITAAGIAAGALDGKGDWALAASAPSWYTTTVTVGGYAANEDPWTIWKNATPATGATAGTNEWRMLLADADLYTDETTDPTQWRTVYIVRGSGAPGTGVTLMTKKLFDTSGGKVTANTQVIGQAS